MLMPNEIVTRPHYMLPAYLDKAIFCEHKGLYNIRPTKVERNLFNSPEDNRYYLGTYFPRSFAECAVLTSDLLRHRRINSALLKKRELRILDLGSGTGGNLLGLLHVLHEAGYPKNPIRIVSKDGNAYALSHQLALVRKFEEYSGRNIILEQREETYTSTESISKSLRELSTDGGFDIIMSFKFVSEFFNTDYREFSDLYHVIVKECETLLSDTGILMLVDVTCRDSCQSRPFTPEIMSTSLGAYLRDLSAELQTVVPVACGFWSSHCHTSPCYTERILTVQHSNAKADMSKFCYRVMAKRPFATAILAELNHQEQYQISYNRWHPRYCKHGNLCNGYINDSGFTLI